MNITVTKQTVICTERISMQQKRISFIQNFFDVF